MLLASLLTISVLVVPAAAPAASEGETRFAQDDLEDLPPPPPPPAIDEGDAPPPPPSLQDAPKSKRGQKQKKKANERAIDEDGEQGPSFIEKYFPLQLDENLHPAIEEKVWIFWVAQLFPFMVVPSAWLPPIVLDGEEPDDYLTDALIIYATHLLPHLCLYAAPIGCLVIPYLNIIALPCVGLCWLANGVTCVANYWYLMPVAFANRMNDGFIAEDPALEKGGWLEVPRDDALASAAMPY